METKFHEIDRLLPRIGLTYREIAKRRDVSHTTVRRILKGIPGQHFSEATRNGIIEEVKNAVIETEKLLKEQIEQWKIAA
jgi:predicted transcriptional regulator